MDDWCSWLERVALGMLGWTVERTLNEDVNAIIIGFRGYMESLQLRRGINPYAPPQAALQAPHKPERVRRVPAPDKLQPLTPELFDAMFPGKQHTRAPRKSRRVAHGR